MEKIDYKGWTITPMFDCATNKEIHIVISNEKIGIAHKITRKCYKTNTEWIRTHSNIWGSKTETEYSTTYHEQETMADLIEEAKAIVEMYDVMKEHILKETKIIESKYGFGKVELVRDDKICKNSQE